MAARWPVLGERMRTLRLARGLTQMELAELAPDSREVVGVVEEPSEGALVRIGRVGERPVCVPAAGSGEGWATADGQVQGGGVELFDVERSAVVVASCDPIVGLAARLMEAAGGPRVMPVATSSATAAAVLAAGRSHAVTPHGPAPRSPEGEGAVRRVACRPLAGRARRPW